MLAPYDPFGRVPVRVPDSIARLARALTVAGLAALVIADRVSPPVLGYLAIGAAIGIVTCIPIGIANVIVIDAACRYGRTRAIGAGIGGALADGFYAALGIFGIGPLLDRYPAVPYVLHALSGVLLVTYGVVLLRSRPAITGIDDERPVVREGDRIGRGIAVGLAATLLNPSAVVTWLVIVGTHASGVTRVQGAAWVAGIVLGTFAWFVVVATLALRGQRALRGNAVWMTRIAAALVVASEVVSIARLVNGLS